jgi:hypothetical protein
VGLRCNHIIQSYINPCKAEMQDHQRPDEFRIARIIGIFSVGAAASCAVSGGGTEKENREPE